MEDEMIKRGCLRLAVDLNWKKGHESGMHMELA
jgi:hypothetical protein